MGEVDLHEAQDRLPELVDRVQAGEEIVLIRHGKAQAKLVAVKSLQATRGMWKGQVWIAEDFDALGEDLAAAFGLDAEPV